MLQLSVNQNIECDQCGRSYDAILDNLTTSSHCPSDDCPSREKRIQTETDALIKIGSNMHRDEKLKALAQANYQITESPDQEGIYYFVSGEYCSPDCPSWPDVIDDAWFDMMATTETRQHHRM